LRFISSPSNYPELEEAVQKHFQLKRVVVQKQLYQWLQDEQKDLPNHTEMQRYFEQYLELTDKKRRAKRKATTDFTVNDQGVIEIDDDDDNGAVKAAMSRNAAAASIEILDDNEDERKLPATINTAPAASLSAVVDLT
jgi:hypothetical protein